MFKRFTSPWLAPELASQGHHQLFLPFLNQPLDYQVKLSTRRRSLSLEIKQQAVFIRAPEHTPQQLINEFLLSKQQWIAEKLSQQAALPQPLMSYQDGDRFLLHGQEITLRLSNASRFSLTFDGESRLLHMTLPNRVKHKSGYVKRQLLQFLTSKMQAYLDERLPELIQQTGLKPKGVELKIFKTRWGCCYQSGLIKINPLLIGAPHWAIDCVLIHELCHLQHLNHSNAFWQLNKRHCPHCQTTKNWLKQQHYALTL